MWSVAVISYVAVKILLHYFLQCYLLFSRINVFFARRKSDFIFKQCTYSVSPCKLYIAVYILAAEGWHRVWMGGMTMQRISGPGMVGIHHTCSTGSISLNQGGTGGYMLEVSEKDEITWNFEAWRWRWSGRFSESFLCDCEIKSLGFGEEYIRTHIWTEKSIVSFLLWRKTYRKL